jgi:fused signal recognition particle receptor
VALSVIQTLISDLKGRLVGRNVKSRELNSFVSEALRNAIADTIAQHPFDIIEFVKSKPRPVKILFVGPNGAGKTTTIAKFAHFLKKSGFSSVLAASDTFRAAAIEQSAEHAQRVGIPVIKHQYGSDPAAVAFNAIKYAEAHNIDVVLIDSAGRQETNRNLIEELRKVSRVANPDLKIFVGEGIVGNAAVSQVAQFNEAIKLDGVILTKVDCDAKGGVVISIAKATGIPILYLGIGQGYDDFIPFDPSFVLSKIFS